MIYWKVIYGHRNGYEEAQVLVGSPEGVPGTPSKRYGPYGPRGETHQPQRGWCAPHMGWPNWRRKGEEGKEKGNRIPPSPSSLPTLNRNRRGGWPNWEKTPSTIPPTWGAPLAASPSLQPIYMWRGGCLQHTTTTTVSRVRRLLHNLHPRSYLLVLRRSPAWITSPSPSPRRRADGTLPRHFAGSRVRGTSSS